MMKAMLDTNVLLDFYLGRGCVADIARMLDAFEVAQAAVYVSALSLKDLFYIVERYLSSKMQELPEQTSRRAREEIAWACLADVQQHFIVAGTGGPEALRARNLRMLHPDFEDNLQIATAEACGAQFFISNDKRLRAACPIAALSPAQMCAYLEA